MNIMIDLEKQINNLLCVCIVHLRHCFPSYSVRCHLTKAPLLLFSLPFSHSDTHHHMIVSVFPSPCDLWQRGFRSRECDNPTAAQQRGIDGGGRVGRGRAQQKGLRQLKRVMRQQYGRLHRQPTCQQPFCYKGDACTPNTV